MLKPNAVAPSEFLWVRGDRLESCDVIEANLFRPFCAAPGKLTVWFMAKRTFCDLELEDSMLSSDFSSSADLVRYEAKAFDRPVVVYLNQLFSSKIMLSLS